jgi:hypothetical protein
VGHGGTGKRQKNLPIIPGLPVPDDSESPAVPGQPSTPPGYRVEQFWAEGPSVSKFMVPARASYKRAVGRKGRRKGGRFYRN